MRPPHPPITGQVQRRTRLSKQWGVLNPIRRAQVLAEKAGQGMALVLAGRLPAGLG